MDFQNLRTVKQIAESNPAFTEASLRWLIYKSDQNGIDEVLVRVGRRVLFDMDRFNDWLERQRQVELRKQASIFDSSAPPRRSYADR